MCSARCAGGAYTVANGHQLSNVCPHEAYHFLLGSGVCWVVELRRPPVVKGGFLGKSTMEHVFDQAEVAG